MSKELEALNKIQHDFGQLKGQELVKCYETIFNGLKRLEAIENANPSEALKELRDLTEYLQRDGINISTTGSYLFIQKALLKAEEQEKVLEIIFEKGLSLTERNIIKQSENYEQYQIKISWWNYKPFAIPKSKEEFDLLKRYCECKSE